MVNGTQFADRIESLNEDINLTGKFVELNKTYTPCLQKIQPSFMKAQHYVLPAFYSIGMLGNIFIIITLSLIKPKSMTNLLLKALAVYDMLYLIFLIGESISAGYSEAEIMEEPGWFWLISYQSRTLKNLDYNPPSLLEIPGLQPGCQPLKVFEGYHEKHGSHKLGCGREDDDIIRINFAKCKLDESLQRYYNISRDDHLQQAIQLFLDDDAVCNPKNIESDTNLTSRIDIPAFSNYSRDICDKFHEQTLNHFKMLLDSKNNSLYPSYMKNWNDSCDKIIKSVQENDERMIKEVDLIYTALSVLYSYLNYTVPTTTTTTTTTTDSTVTHPEMSGEESESSVQQPIITDMPSEVFTTMINQRSIILTESNNKMSLQDLGQIEAEQNKHIYNDNMYLIKNYDKMATSLKRISIHSKLCSANYIRFAAIFFDLINNKKTNADIYIHKNQTVGLFAVMNDSVRILEAVYKGVWEDTINAYYKISKKVKINEYKLNTNLNKTDCEQRKYSLVAPAFDEIDKKRKEYQKYFQDLENGVGLLMTDWYIRHSLLFDNRTKENNNFKGEEIYQLLFFIKILARTFQFASCCQTVLIAGFRYIAICLPYKAPKFCTYRNAVIGSILCFVISMLIHVPHYILIGSNYDTTADMLGLYTTGTTNNTKFNETNNVVNETIKNGSESDNFNMFFSAYHIGFYNVGMFFSVPFFLLAFFNVRLIRELYQGRGMSLDDGHRDEENKEVTKVVLAVVFVYIITYVPLPIYIIDKWFFQNYVHHAIVKVECKAYLVVNFIIWSFPSINSSVNFLIYCVLRKTFRRKVMKIAARFNVVGMVIEVSRTFDEAPFLDKRPKHRHLGARKAKF